MLNPLGTPEVVSAIGRTARDIARSDEPLDDFARGQLMSAYSGSRHLAVELSSFEPELQAFCARIVDEIRLTAPRVPDSVVLRGIEARLLETSDPRRIGAAVCELLELVRAHPSSTAAALRAEVRSALHALCDREVDLLADAIEGERAS